MLKVLNDVPEYVPCVDCCSFDKDTENCGIYNAKTDPYVQMYGCGKGETDVPF